MKKKKILLLSDDLRMHSGIATQSKEIVMGTIHKYDWVQIGAAVTHPDEGKIINMTDALKSELNLEGYLVIYPSSGYGNSQLLREVIARENPDAILHFTDPRQWIWLYQMEHELRRQMPIFYYNIWDDLPTPKYNEMYYRSSDLLLAISKQTYGINKRLLPDYEDWQIKYIPHGLDEKAHFKVDNNDTKFKSFMKKSTLDRYEFKVLYLNRNIRRKQPGDVVMAYKHFIEQLPEEKRKQCCLVFHTQPSDENGTDLRAVCKEFIPKENVLFTHDTVGVLDDQQMNFIYNGVDVYVNLASNEGFGLGSAEALMAETPIVVNVTGGLQDQCGFKKQVVFDGAGATNEYLTAEDYVELGSNHRGKHKQHGEWVKPVFPSNVSLQGSPLTPYIYDDRVQYEDAGEAIKYWYDLDKETRDKKGAKGKEFLIKAGMTGQSLSNNFIEAMDEAFKKWKPRKRYTLENV